MESKGYDVRDRSLVGILASLTYGILNRAESEPGAKVTAHPQPHSVGLLDRLDTWFWKQEVASREAFLAESADIVDLEQRMRRLERGHN